MSSKDLSPTDQTELHSLVTAGTPTRPGKSFVAVAEPCEKHAEKPPGEQSWKDDGTKKRDPNGFDHDCAACRANFKIQEA